MYLKRLVVCSPEFSVLHIAPEKGLADWFNSSGCDYTAADIDPLLYPELNCQKIDLCDLGHWPSSRYDLIVHSHVLEHTLCNIAYTLRHLHRMLTEDGIHMCIIPFMQGKWEESFQDYSDYERKKKYGQSDHVRRFGITDINRHLGCIVRMPSEFKATDEFDRAELEKYNIPESHWSGFSMGTVLQLRKNDYLL